MGKLNVLLFCALITSSSTAFASTEGTEPVQELGNGIGIFDGVCEIYDGSSPDTYLPASEYDVAYDSSLDAYTVQVDPEKFGRQNVFLQKRISGSNYFSAKIIFSTTDEAVNIVEAAIQDAAAKHIYYSTFYSGKEKLKRTRTRFQNDTEGWANDSDLKPFSESYEEVIYYRIIQYADLHQAVCEWSVDGKHWEQGVVPVSFDKEHIAFINMLSSVKTAFRLENVAIKPITFSYGRRTVERIEDQSVRVILEITSPTLPQDEIEIQENIEGDVSVTYVSHNGRVEDATGNIETHKLRWELPASAEKTRLEYIIKANPTSFSSLALFHGFIHDKLIVGTGEYSFAKKEDVPEDFRHWRTWTSTDNLPDTKVRYLNLGFSQNMYVINFNPRTTISHLNRFDGYEYHSVPLNEELKDGFVKEGMDGSLWFYQNWYLYLQKVDKKGTVTWELCRTSDNRPLKVTDQLASSFLHFGDKSAGGNLAKYQFIPIDAEHIYCLTRDQLRLYNANTQNEIVLLEAGATSLEYFGHMILSRDRNLWITGKRGVIKVDIQNANNLITAEYTVPENSSLKDFTLPIEGYNGNLLMKAEHAFVTPTYTYMVILDKRFQLIALGHGSPLSFSDKNNIWMLGVDDDKVEYIANYRPDGRRVLPPGKNRVTSRTGDFDNEGNGSFWLGSDYGLIRYSPPLWRKPEAVKDIQSEISMITEDARGNIWALEKELLLKFNGKKWKKYPKPKGLTYWRYKTQSLVCMPDERLAINTGDPGYIPKPFCIFNPQSETFEFIYHPEKLHCDNIAPGNRHNLLAVTFNEARVAQIDAYEKGEYINLVDSQEGVLMGINNICELSNGDILIGSDSDEHLQWFANGKKKPLIEDKQYPGYTALSILEIEPSKIWIGDNNNIYEFNGDRWSVVRTNLNNVMSMIQSRDGSIWVATWTGLHRYKDNYWVTHNTQDGFGYDIINKIFEDSQGRLWAGSEDGVYLYHPEADPDPPQTYIPEKENLKDFASKGEVRINFTGIDRWKYTEQDRLLYSYRLNQGEWSPFDTPNVATFANMPPDDYTIEVQAMDRNWNIDPSPASFSFRVNHVPIQERAWFIPLIAGTISLILLLAILAVVSRFQLAEFARNLESMVETRTKELHQTQRNILSISEREQQRIGQDLHDDVVQDLVGIAINSEVLLEELLAESPKRAEELQKILTKMDDATVKTQRLARGLSPVSIDKLGLVGSLQNICTHIRDYYGMECYYHGDQKIPHLDSAQRLNLYRIAQEATNNAIKHAAASQIVIQLSHTTDRLTLEIRDNGNGFDGGGSILGMGLHIMNYRANTIGAEFDIKSAFGQGTSVICVLPLSKNGREEERA